MILPGWDSLVAAGKIAHWFHIAALTFVFLLAVSEIIAFVYSERQDTLAGISDKVAQLQRNAPRNLSTEAQEALRATLGSFSGMTAWIGTTTPLVHTYDIDSLGAQLADALLLAGWKVTPGVTWGSDDRPIGIVVSAREGQP
jgi:hypothetical protein